jgi:hypothetical protein
MLGSVRGECRFEYTSTSVCTLKRFNGRYLFINGQNELIPATEPTLANSALASNDTTYYVYAYMDSGTMTLEASATAHATDATYGHKIKSGDATRTLVGMVRKTSGDFYDSDLRRYTLSWFNRRLLALYQTDTTTIYTTTIDLAAVSALVWSDESVMARGSISAYNSSGLDNIISSIRIDSADYSYTADELNNGSYGTASSGVAARLSEGFHSFYVRAHTVSIAATASYANLSVLTQG